jgi:hypothetical protein
MRGRLPSEQPASNQSKIDKIFEAMNLVCKQLHDLYKLWENTGNPEARMELRHRINELEELLETMRREIITLTQLEHRRKQQHAQQLQAAALAAVTTTGSPSMSDAENPDIYYPPGAVPQSSGV